MGLIEFLKSFIDSQNDSKRKKDTLLERCLNASESDLEELSQLLSSSPDVHLQTLQTFISNLYNENSRVTPRIRKQDAALSNFTSELVTIVVMRNLHHSGIPGFREFLRKCVELLWLVGNKDKLDQTMKDIVSEILNTDGILGVLVSSDSGRHCLNRILFEFKMSNRIEREELLRAVDVVATLVEKCSGHVEISRDLSESLSEYKACTALLKTLKVHRRDFGEHQILISLDEQHFELLRMNIPRKTSELPHLLPDLENKKIDLLQHLMEFSPCTRCHRQALYELSPGKYFSEEESLPPFRLPFEFDDGDRLGLWDVLLSDDTIEDIRSLNLGAIEAVKDKLVHISSGKWGKHELQCIAWDKHNLQHKVPTNAIPVYEIELPDNYGLKILWSVDYGFSIRSYSLTQLIKVWAVTNDLNQMDKILDNLSIVHQVYTSKQSDRCVVRQIGINDKICPMIFEDEEETKSSENALYDKIKEQVIDPDIDDKRLLEVHKMFVTNKFYPVSRNLFNSLILGGLKFTFQISNKEYDIIRSRASTIIIGRSGTGKTTCIVFRQITSYLNNQLCDDNNRNFYKRQIFITVSPKLCDRVKEYFYKLRKSAMLAGNKMTREQFLEYKQNMEDEIVTNDTLFEEKDEVISFHDLEDRHFPLFITYDKFSEMLLETYGINSKNLTLRKLHEITPDNNNQSFYNEHFINYNVFYKKYWPSLRDFCQRKFDCGLVFSEFSIIKGLNPEGNNLTRKEYNDASEKKYPAFRYNRDQIYDLFEHYEKLKRRNGQYDSMDRTSTILRYAKTKAFGGPHIHEVYIDECQDNRIADLALILKVFNRADSCFFAGDIAQCISQGSSFRFQDLSDLIYNWEKTRTQINHNQHNIKPNEFELNVNYRCHNGILQLASSVIDLIWKFFPDSIDKLPREIGEVDGPRPVIIDGFQEKHFAIFSIDNNTGNVEFGAEQAIIVRDDETKSHMEKLIGNAGMILTVFEAKGMEFNDVLLYNFFTNSLACSKWRVILSDLSENSEGTQTFSHEKHYILSSEFKHLYVAITRAKQRIWICDENTEYSMPIQTYWKQLGLIKIIQSEYDIFTTFANQSNSDEWNKKGEEFLVQKLYKQAIFCFEKSGNEDRRKQAYSYYLLQFARDSRDDSDDKTVKSNFIDAAQAFEECSLPKKAALCYEEIGMIEEAGKVYVRWEMFEPAAHCYRKIKMWNKAGRYFEKAGKYIDAAFSYLDGSLYDTSVDLLEKYKQEIDGKIFHRITDSVKIHYRDTAILNGKFEEPVDVFIRLIYDDDDVIEALQFILYICGNNILKTIITNITNTTSPSNLRKLLSKKDEIIANIKFESTKETKQWRSLIEKFKLYLAYLDKNFHDCIQFFRDYEEPVNEFHAVSIWLYLPQSDIQVEYWHKRLQYLLRLCELAFPFIKSYSNNKDFENIFFINEVNNSQERQIPFGNLLLNMITNIKDQNIYDKDGVYQKISQSLALYIFELIQEAYQKGKNIPDISFQICENFIYCQKSNCKNHHVIPTPLILYRRLNFACLQCSVMQKLDILYYKKLLKDDQYKEIRVMQRFWIEKLVMTHLRYQSPQTSCPEITYTVLAKLPKHTRDGFFNIVHKTWLLESKSGSNFEIILKCMFVLQQLQDNKEADKFYSELSKMTMFSNPINVPIDPVISFGKRLSLFFFFLYSNQVTHAISHAKKLIQYALDNIQPDMSITSDIFSDLVSLMEFSISLVFAAGSKYCDLCLPRAYLVNYFEAFTLEPLVSNKNTYNNNDYLDAINDSFNQVQQLLGLLTHITRVNSAIILRLIRILVLIGLNESTFTPKVFELFKHLNGRVLSANIKKYLEGRYTEEKDIKKRENDVFIEEKERDTDKDMKYLVNVLHNDLKETGCDSLVIVHHYHENSSKFSDLEEYGIMKLTYNSIEGFHSALQRVLLSEITKYDEDQELSAEVYAWFHKKVVKKIQAWYRRIYNQKKFRELHPILNIIYDDIVDFCQIITEEKGRDAVYKYNILLRGPTVDMILNLIELREKMDKTMDKLQQSIDNCYSDSDELEYYLELKEDLRCNHYENVDMALRSLSVTENMEKHVETNIEWLENELHQAEATIEQVLEWVDKCNDINSDENYDDVVTEQ